MPRPRLRSRGACLPLISVALAALLPPASGAAPLWPTDPVPCRDDLAIVAARHFNKTGVAAEVGVHRGRFSRSALQAWLGRYYMIDAWAYRPQDGEDLNHQDESINADNMRHAVVTTRRFGHRRVIRGLSVDVATRFEDGALDWVYIDAQHTYDVVLTDLNAWYPKGHQLFVTWLADCYDTPAWYFVKA